MKGVCIGQPLSWLTLESYFLGEITDKEKINIESHLKSCPACQECFESIKKDAQQELKPWAYIEPKLKSTGLIPRGSLAWIAASVSLVLAMLIVGIIWSDWEQKQEYIPQKKIAFKGGSLAISLVREREGSVLHEPTTFSPKDRLKVLVTCPPGENISGELVVFQDGKAFFPFPPLRPVRCGNRMA